MNWTAIGLTWLWGCCVGSAAFCGGISYANRKLKNEFAELRVRLAAINRETIETRAQLTAAEAKLSGMRGPLRWTETGIKLPPAIFALPWQGGIQ